MEQNREAPEGGVEVPLGIIVRDRVEPAVRPLISAFIWGGKVRPAPTLPYGRMSA